MEYKIEENVPPQQRKIYPFDKLNPGQSIFFPTTDPAEAKRISGAARMYQTRHPGVKFSTKKEKEGVRVWRLE